MSAKRRRALSIMERLLGNDMDQVARDMAVLRDQMDDLHQSKYELTTRLREERHAAAIEAVPFVGSFVDAMNAQIQQVDDKMAEIEPELARFEDQLHELYREQKVYESVRLKDLRDESKEIARREAAELEELTILRWNR